MLSMTKSPSTCRKRKRTLSPAFRSFAAPGFGKREGHGHRAPLQARDGAVLQRHRGFRQFFHGAGTLVDRPCGRLLRRIASGARARTDVTRQTRQTRFGIDQELARYNDLLSLFQAAQHGELAVHLLPDFHLHGRVLSRLLGDEGERALAGANDRVDRHHQGFLAFPGDGDLGEHAGLEPLLGIRELHAHAQRARLAIGLREHRRDLPFEYLARVGGEARFDRAAGDEHGRMHFGHGGLQPHGAQPVDARERHAGRHRHPCPDPQLLYHARDRGGDRHHRAELAGLLDARDLRLGHAEQPQALARSRGQLGVPGGFHGEKLGLRSCPFADEHVGERSAGAGSRRRARGRRPAPRSRRCGPARWQRRAR